MQYRKNTVITMILLISASVMVSLYYAKKEQIKKDYIPDLVIPAATLPLEVDPVVELLPISEEPELPPSVDPVVELLPMTEEPELLPGVSLAELILNPALIEEAVAGPIVEVKENSVANLDDIVSEIKTRRVTGDGQQLQLEPTTLLMLAKLEQQWGEQLNIRWAYRGKDLNDKVGGVEHSQHLNGKAVDVVHNGWSKDKMTRFVKLAHDVGFRGFGLGPTTVHLDSRDSLGAWLYPGSPYPLATELLK